MYRCLVNTAFFFLLTLMIIPVTVDANDSPAAIRAPMAARSLLLGGALAGDRMLLVGERGHVLISRDQGDSWTQAEMVPTRTTLTAVYFVDEQQGLAIGHQAVILRTRDGGQNWQEVFSAPELDQPLFDIWFSDAQHGFAVGAYGYFLETVDGGETWEERRISEDDWHLNQIARMDDDSLFIAAEAGTLYRSVDGGQNWSSLVTPYRGSFHGLVSLGGESLVAFGLRGHLFRSDDVGETWYELDSGVTTLLTGGTLIDDGRLVLCGVAGTVLVGNQDSSEFLPMELPDRRSLAGILFSNGSLIAYGEGGVLKLPLSDVDVNN